MKVRQWIKTPKGYVILCMLAYVLLASAGSMDIKGIINAGIAVSVSAAADMLCTSLVKKKRTPPYSAVITGLIVALILSTSASWIVVAATSLLAIIPKYVFVNKKKAIFNPAALGLLLSSLLFQTGQSWWGAFGDLPAWTLIFPVIGGYLVTNRVNKFPLVFSFLGTYFVLLLIMGIFQFGDATDALRIPYINASLFFALFMLTDPPTSPAKYKDQIIFGILCAVVGVMVYVYFGGLIYLFAGLLAGNLYHYARTRPTYRTQASRASLS